MSDRMEVRSSVPIRKFVMVHEDFLEADFLSVEEKMVYIVLKSFMAYGQDSDEVYPSMETICRLSSMSRPRATRVINSLIRKGVVKKRRRGVTKSNVYTISDFPAMWQKETSQEERKKLLESEIPYTTGQLVEELIRRGILPNESEKPEDTQPADNKKGSVSVAAEPDPDGRLNKNNIVSTTTNDSTHFYEYSQEYIYGIYSYDILAKRLSNDKKSLDAVMEILYETLNSHEQTIRIKGDEKSSEVVKSKLLKLDYDDIWYSIIQFKGTKNRIKKPKEYMLSILYGAKEQRILDFENSKNHILVLAREEQEQDQEEEEQPLEEMASKNIFCNFPQNRYDFDKLEKELDSAK